jgi:hypothetical protein
MTRFTVSWRPEVQEDLAGIWLAAADRPAITFAADRIDQLLANDPTTQGNEVSEGLRAIAVDPLVVYFTVSEADRLVTVWAVRAVSP